MHDVSDRVRRAGDDIHQAANAHPLPRAHPTRRAPNLRSRRHVSFLAFGRQFEILLQQNEGMQRALPAGRNDILPYRGTLQGQAGTWVRLTQTRGGWRGVVFDGEQMYAIAPASEVAEAAVQPLGVSSGSAPIIYRFADALLPVAADFCQSIAADGSVRSDACGSPVIVRAGARIPEW